MRNTALRRSAAHLGIVPMEFPHELEHLVKSTLHEHVVEEVLDESVHRWDLDHFPSDAFRRVALIPA